MAQENVDMKVIAFHGWGCDASDWKTIANALPTRYSVDIWDRGYFGKSNTNLQDEYDLVLTHSMGLFQVPNHVLQNAKCLIALHPFAYFPSQNVQIAALVQKQLDRMIYNLKQSPVDQVQAFRRQAGLEHRFLNAEDIDSDALIEDLNRLKTDSLNIDHIKPISKVVWIHENQDSIIPTTCRTELETLFPFDMHLSIGHGTHAYSLIYPETLINMIATHESI